MVVSLMFTGSMINSDYVPVGCSVKVRGCDKIVFNVGCLIITPLIYFFLGGSAFQ